ncbi:MAG: sigma-54-dependent Fis family transcriptional regulator [Candidatus Latescibacteria bacterium]|nr:sigma-54-dependent Fis family transcriptional regulator [Candidatus Latescibacterota bacterium]
MNPWTILVIDGEQDSRRLVAETLRPEGYTVLEAVDGTAALQVMREATPDLILLDLGLTDIQPERLLRTLKKKNPDCDVILTTRQRRGQSAAQALRQGVDDYAEKPVDPAELLDKVRVLQMRQQFLREFQFIGKNEKMIQVMEQVLQVAPTQILVLIVGESGTGKDVIARAIHEHSTRRNGPFIPVNCAAIAEGILESELFGHERGAFTGATGRRKGFFELADDGTLFLDEVGEMPLATQVKLLRVLEQQRFMRVGGSEQVHADVRVIAATNKDLEEAIRNGTFRRDLYYRLKVVTIHLPPLRERRDDIPRLIDHFVAEATQKHQVPFAGFTAEAMAWLIDYEWPGNVREIRNLIESLVITMNGRGKVRVEDLPESISRSPVMDRSLPVAVNRSRDEVERELIYKALLAIRADIDDLRAEVRTALQDRLPLSLPGQFVVPSDASRPEPRMLTPVEPGDARPVVGKMDDVEREMIRNALEVYHGHREKVAKALGIGVRTLYRKLEKYGLTERGEKTP